MATAKKINIEVAYATPERQQLIELSLPAGATVQAALECCAEQRLLPEDALRTCDVGIFGQRVNGDRLLSPGDRVELYRELEIDPKEARRLRAAGRRRGSG